MLILSFFLSEAIDLILLIPSASAFTLKLNIDNQMYIIREILNSKTKCVRAKTCDLCAFRGVCSKVGDSKCQIIIAANIDP